MSDALRQALGKDVSRETLERLETHLTLLAKWNPAINLVSPATLDDAWTRHIVDSAQVFSAKTATSGLWLDIGSGGGFPGLVCASLAKEFSPDLDFALVESDRRKCVFLRTVAQTLSLEVRIYAERLENLPPQAARVISARAFAPLPDLFTYVGPHLATDGECLFPKGAQYRDEIAAAQKFWRFKLASKPSITDPKAVILACGDIERV